MRGRVIEAFSIGTRSSFIVEFLFDSVRVCSDSLRESLHSRRFYGDFTRSNDRGDEATELFCGDAKVLSLRGNSANQKMEDGVKSLLMTFSEP